MGEHIADPNARSWEALKSELGFTEAEREEIGAGAQRLIAQARVEDAPHSSNSVGRPRW
jgi:hypothetical protein